ncbi:MAG TPA: GNAT family N-acetyltransferase [Candidatus Angelobacter sp.]|nr:GNAT family N-acetyltransferase [Candidatus Angelobacter sp.]
MNPVFQLLSESEIPVVLELMREFYAQTHMTLNESVATATLKKMLADPSKGELYLIFRGSDLAGYFVLTWCFSLEFHGTFALLDELYIRTQHRRQRLGKAVVAFAESACKKAGIKALRLETGDDNEAAQRLYSGAGMKKDERFLFTKWL